MKPHSFDPLIAKEVGIECAILLYNIEFWIEKNKANGKHYYEGKYWTYNSTKAFAELFPYMSERVIYKSLQKLIEGGYLVKGNFNQNTFDRTCWYALGEKIDIATRENPNYQMGDSILPNGKMEITNSENDINVSDINTDINHFENTDSRERACENQKDDCTNSLEVIRESFRKTKELYKQVKPSMSDLLFQKAEQEFFRIVREGVCSAPFIAESMEKQVKLWSYKLKEDSNAIKYIPRLENWLSKKTFFEDFDTLLKPYEQKNAIKQRGTIDYGSNDDDGFF